MQTQAKGPTNQKRRPVRRKVKRALVWKIGSCIVIFLAFAIILAMQVNRQYQLQREMNALKEEISAIKGTNETYLTSLEFIDITEVKSAANRAGLHAPQPNQLIGLDFNQWAKMVDSIPVIDETDYSWTPSITPYRAEQATPSQGNYEIASESSILAATSSEITNSPENEEVMTTPSTPSQEPLQQTQTATAEPARTTETEEPSQAEAFEAVGEEAGTTVNQEETVDQADLFDMVQEETDE